MADPNDSSRPGNPGDLQPARRIRGTADFPLPQACDDYRPWANAWGTSPADYGYHSDTCSLCGHRLPEHELHDAAPGGDA